MPETFDIAVVGAGAAGLFAGIFAGRAAASADGTQAAPLRVIALDGARSLGAKILVAGGGRCNVTHDVVDERAYAGSSRNAVRKVLRAFDAARTVEFFRDLGVELKREETGKLFPTTDRARTVLDALLGALAHARVELRHPWRVEAIERTEIVTASGDTAPGFRVLGRVAPPAPSSADAEPADGASAPSSGALTPPRDPSSARDAAPLELLARRVILATGGRSLPKSGSDGHGHAMARALGHSITSRVFPALVPLTLPKDHWVCALSGLTVPATIELRSAAGKRLESFTDSLLCTHFGLSGPSVLDISRYWTDERALCAAENRPAPLLVINWTPGLRAEDVDAAVLRFAGDAREGGSGVWRALAALDVPARVPGHPEPRVPERLARAICISAGVDPATPARALTREQRRALVRACVETPAPATGDRGYNYAEVTAGGVPLSEIRLETMESRLCPGLHLCGEICDVDGRIGGYNFQWAWASGHVAGVGAARAILAGAPAT